MLHVIQSVYQHIIYDKVMYSYTSAYYDIASCFSILKQLKEYQMHFFRIQYNIYHLVHLLLLVEILVRASH